MSPRTTLILVALLAAALGAIWWFNRGAAPPPTADRRVLPGLLTSDVRAITINPDRPDAPFRGPLVLARGDNEEWTLTLGSERPVRARAEKARALVETLREAAFVREITTASRNDVARHGLDAGNRVLVEIALKGGGVRRLVLGAAVSETGVAALADERWPPIEIDRQIQDDLLAGPGTLREQRLAPFDATLSQALRVTFPREPDLGFHAVRESGQWEIRAPALLRADQAMLMRLLASLSGLAGTESQAPDSRAPTGVLVRYEVTVQGREGPVVVEIGDARKDDVVPARSGPGEPWILVSLAGLDLVGQPVGQFRSRRLLGVDGQDVKEVVVSRGPERLLRLKRAGLRFNFVPPESWKWEFMGPLELPLDPSAQADFLQLLVNLEAADFERGPSFDAELVLEVRHGESSVAKLRFGKDEAGRRVFARFGDAAEGHVRSRATEFLTRPYYELLARQAHTSAWFSLTTIEVRETGKRNVVITATRTDTGQPEFVLSEPHAEHRRKVPKEVVTPVIDKLCLLTVERFVGHGEPAAFGLDKPAYEIRWLDSGKSEGIAPNPLVGTRATWRVGARDTDGLNAGDLSTAPGLVFKTGARDLDPFQSLLEWAYR